VYAETINKKEGTNFSKHYICYALSQTLPDDYGYYGLQKKLAKYSGIFYRKDFMLNIPACLDLISELNPHRKKSTLIRIELEKMMEQLGIKRVSQEMNPLFLQARNQLVEIIDLYNHCLPANIRKVIVKDNYLIFNTKPVLNIYESAIEVLRASNKPMHFREIYARLIENNKFVSSVSSLHSLIMIHPEHFGLKGSGHYGLREWGGYFGSIGDVTEQILVDRNAPINREELFKILCSEHYISRDSIMNVLFHYKYEDRFMRYKNDTIALKRWYNK
jgi:hypothetical protein